MTDLSYFLVNLTSEPGIYRLIDKEDTVLYVGKARNLKKRVSSYFTKQNTGAKTRSLVMQTTRVEVTITRSETEALLLESNLIKALRPKYNVLMRDDKSYPYIYVNADHEFPRIEMTRNKKKSKKGLYFGPYPSVAAIRETLNTIQKVFKIRNCRDSYFNARARPCLQYQIKRCTAPCTRYISPQEYRKSIEAAIKFLQGKCQLVLEDLTARMDEAVVHLHFEEAAVLRDQIKSLRLVQERQGVAQLQGDADIIAIHVEPGFASIQCVTVREGTVIANQSFFPTLPPVDEAATHEQLLQQVFEAFLGFYYLEEPQRIPGEIILATVINGFEIAGHVLTDVAGKACKIIVKPRGDRSRWVKFAQDNLSLSIQEKKSSSTLIAERYDALKQLIGINKSIERMECFDISHTQGNYTVASCVVFDSKGPNKKEYRRFNIEGITGGDDYQAMEQALTRRYKRVLVEGVLPDILIIDGGKGQITVARRVLEQLNITGVELLGVAKGADRKVGWERLIIAAEAKEITLPSDSQALHLLQHIRDEAHRFAITAHRKKRQKMSIYSTLEEIEGIGPKKRHALLQRFGGIRDLAKASREEIAKVVGINDELAGRIFHHFHE